MAHLYVNPETDSIYLDVTAGDRSPSTAVEPAMGVYLHLDEAGVVVAVEVMGMSRRTSGGAHEPSMGDVHINPGTDTLYVDVSAGTRPASEMMEVADGVLLHVDKDGDLTGVEVMRLGQRGGLQVSDLDAERGRPRPVVFGAIERAASIKIGDPRGG